MAGQLVKQLDDLSIPLTDWHLVFETLFLVSKTQRVGIEFTLVDTRLLNNSNATYGAQVVVKIGLNGPGQNNEADAGQTLTYPNSNAPFGIGYTVTKQVFHPASGTLTLDPGHYVVTVQVKYGGNGWADTLTARKAYLAISGGG